MYVTSVCHDGLYADAFLSMCFSVTSLVLEQWFSKCGVGTTLGPQASSSDPRGDF